MNIEKDWISKLYYRELIEKKAFKLEDMKKEKRNSNNKTSNK